MELTLFYNFLFIHICKACVPSGRLSTLAPRLSAHVWARWFLSVLPHEPGVSTPMWLFTESRERYVSVTSMIYQNFTKR